MSKEIKCPRCNGCGCGESDDGTTDCDLCGGRCAVSPDVAAHFHAESIMYLYAHEMAHEVRVPIREAGMAIAQLEKELANVKLRMGVLMPTANCVTNEQPNKPTTKGAIKWMTPSPSLCTNTSGSWTSP